ncbi:MAG: glycolate oxidase subunit GlcF [bacterium]|nr:glycolate oxidase subunit GlcF [bacterium]
MKTQLAPRFAGTPLANEAQSILRSCVHCGFCNATCPTYQTLNDERDGPRGRIYLIKELFEGTDVTSATRTHLDRCLTCRSCETTCPSGVQYGRLIDMARGVMEEELPRHPGQRLIRWGLRKTLPNATLFGALLRVGQSVRPLMPAALKSKIPPRQISSPQRPHSNTHKRVMLLLEGCAQPSATPNTNAAVARVLDQLGISLTTPAKTGCCGAVSYHLGAHEEGLDNMRTNIDTWWPDIKNGAEAIVISASGCGTMIKEYGHLLKDDPTYAQKAARVSDLAKDIAEILANEQLDKLNLCPTKRKVTLHNPCTLQHGQALPDLISTILKQSGFELLKTSENHLCCGSAGTYSILQPAMAKRLLTRKISVLEGEKPDLIATANIGCQLHLQTGTKTPVLHWIELIDQAIEI